MALTYDRPSKKGKSVNFPQKQKLCLVTFPETYVTQKSENSNGLLRRKIYVLFTS